MVSPRSIPCSFLALLAGLLPAWHSAIAEDKPLSFIESFDSGSESTLLRDRLKKSDTAGIENQAGPDQSDALRVTYLSGKRGSVGISESVRLGFTAPVVSLSYDLKFAEDFDFSRGGKLPGIGPEEHVTGGKPMHPDGWSARPMWREDGLLTSYTYHQDKPERNGHYSRSNGFFFTRGKFHAVTVVVAVNSARGKKDGRVEIYVDGELQVTHENLDLHASDNPERAYAGRLLFTTFHGGNDSSWAPRDAEGNFRNVTAWFDNVSVVKGKQIRPAPGK